MDALYYWLVISWLSNGSQPPFCWYFFSVPLSIYTMEPLTLEWRNLEPTEQLYLWSYDIPQMTPGPTKTPEGQGRQYTRICPLLVVYTQPGNLGKVVLQVENSWWDLCGFFRQGTEKQVGVRAWAFLERSNVWAHQPSAPRRKESRPGRDLCFPLLSQIPKSWP